MGITFYCVFMKTAETKRSKYLIALSILIFVCEILLKFNNKIMQCFGICTLPIIVVYGVLLFKNEKSKI